MDQTAFFKVARSTLKHGDGLVCSHEQCRKVGVRFLYCSVCNEAVAKGNFFTRHGHGLRRQGVSNPSTSEDNKNATTKTKRNKYNPAEGAAKPQKRKDRKKSNEGVAPAGTALSRHHVPSSIITRPSFTASSSSSSSFVSEAPKAETMAAKPHPSLVDGNKNSADSSFESNSRKKRRLDSFIEQREQVNTEKPSSLLVGCSTAEEGDGTIGTNMNESY
jgi:hypothetical protein